MTNETTAGQSRSVPEQSNLNEIIALLGTDVAAGFKCGSSRARSWRTPPNWSFSDWRDEVLAVAISSAWQAKQDFDPSRGVTLAEFVSSRVSARALTRYRQEWRFALGVVMSDAEIIERLIDANPLTHSLQKPFESLNRVLARLPAEERWLLNQIFWRRRTETEIAAELQISQPAVSKRKRAALLHLRAFFEYEKKF
jgi:RNA polymerase sigma factor (sigma-70 family)